MSKSPAFQFYVGDWIQDTRALSLSTKGAWIDLLCAMWRSQTRGQLSLPILGYARLIGATVEQTKAVIDELTEMQICDYETNGNGNVTLINRRMVREEKERESTRLRVQRFRNTDEKRLGNEKVTGYSSTSSSKQKKNIKKKVSDEEFWKQIKETYTWVDHELEEKKMAIWLGNHTGRTKTRKFVINWYAKKDKPLTTEINGETFICSKCNRKLPIIQRWEKTGSNSTCKECAHKERS